ncbi:MAG: DoxX family protein [Limisphaerales bacterium]
MKFISVFAWCLQIVSALIMAETLFFKFTAAPESVYIFSTLGMEPYGRIGTGIVELIASILLLIPSLVWLGAGLGLGLMSGAIMSHLTQLGIVVLNDGGRLFIYAMIVFISCCILLILNRKQIPIIKNFF